MIRFLLALCVGLAAGYWWGYDHGQRGVETALHRAIKLTDPFVAQRVRQQRAQELRAHIQEASGISELDR